MITEYTGPDPALESALRQVRVVVKTVMIGRTLHESADLAEVSASTLNRILRGENITLATFAKIVGRLGGQLVIKVER